MAKAKSKTTDSAAPLGQLVDRLGPINNQCRTAEGIDKVELLWDLGNALLEIAPDANDQLLRDIHEHSYITRDILRYGLIIRRGWNNRSVLRKQFPRLSRYSMFREALPFLKGDRCGIDDDLHDKIVKQLNSNDSIATKEFLKSLKQDKIGRRHKKGQAEDRMAVPIERLRQAFRQLIEVAESEPEQLVGLASKIGHTAVVELSQFCVALADNSPLPPIPNVGAGLEPLTSIHTTLSSVSQANSDDRNGFRKGIGAVTLMEIADALNATRSYDRLTQWSRRKSMNLRFP